MFGSKARPLGPHRARARSAARLVAAPLVALVLIIASGTAYADVDWEVKSVDGGYKAKIAPYDYPDGLNGAACEFLGYNWDSFSQDVKTGIAGDPDYLLVRDHRLKNLAYQYFEGEGQGVIGEWLEAVGNKVVASWTKLFGNDKIWVAECSYEEYGNARKAIQKWAFANDGNTGDEGGGSGGGNEGELSGDYRVFRWTEIIDENYNSNIVGICCKESNYVTAMNNFSSRFPDGKPFFAFCEKSQGKVCYYLGCNNRPNVYAKKLVITSGSSYVGDGTFFASNTKVINGETYIDVSSYISRTADRPSVTNIDRDRDYVNIYAYWWGGEDGAPGGGGSDPEPWVPVPDPDPTRPVIQIGDVTIDLSNGPYTIGDTTYSVVYAPDNSWSVSVETHTDTPYDGNVTATDPTDYTSILNAILQAINKFRSEFNTAYNDIDAQLTTMLNTFTTALKNVETTLNNQLQAMQTQNHQDIQTLQTNLQSTITGRWDTFAEDLWKNLAAMDGDLIDEIFKDAKYIVDNLNFNADFDDSDIVLWLKRIYSRVKDRKVSIPSPDEDPTGWADAIGEFLAKILSMMVTGLDVAQIASLFDDLKNRFPISIPWDMVAILYLFDGEPVTPVFDWPIYDGETLVTNLHCDFSDFDDAMGYVRQGELLLFAIGLMYNTKWLMNVETQVIDHRKG